MARARYIDAIDPRWYGSVDELEKFKMDLARQPLDASSKRYLSFSVEQSLAFAQWSVKDYDEAEQHFRKAAKLCDVPRPWQDLGKT